MIMKIISLFNHKGGVSKTTTTFNLGYMLAEQGHKTLIVDADPQCNLTALVLGYNSIDDAEQFFLKNLNCDIYSCLKPIIDGSLGRVITASPLAAGNGNLSLLCGNIALAEIETQISVALTTSAAIPAIRNIPGSIGAFIRQTAEAHEFEYVLVDMSPSVGALNECLLMASDYFIVPTAPDFFCAQAIKSLTTVIPQWNKEISVFRQDDMLYPFPKSPPKFIGFLSQKYRPRNGMPAKSFQRWIDTIKAEVTKSLIPALAPIGMAVDASVFRANVAADEPFNLANIADFNSLIAQSQEHNVPVFALTDTQIEQSGKVLENMIESRDGFKATFDQLAREVHQITEAA
jgi:cellulose biosynthesis protein BcsQ